MVCFGFGFDPIGNDYKVVALLTCFGKPWTAEVYYANTNVWRTVKPNPKDLPSYDDFDVCVNGFCVVWEPMICFFAQDMATHSACSFGGGKAERLAFAKYCQVIWQGRVLKSQFTDEELRGQGRCPLTREEIGLLLVAVE
ncbi:hypothetical protein POM88_024339 [Heracleum sosnowskyi]|uniref:Uncharacterized protein n=1 Tax=Heracleum sosnowskyi TaxID=360622 RepID=A0AAD8MIS9_9APIA|nr:hypothetical protein POM88_024339 [Heracleum sosnowskyi]